MSPFQNYFKKSNLDKGVRNPHWRGTELFLKAFPRGQY